MSRSLARPMRMPVTATARRQAPGFTPTMRSRGSDAISRRVLVIGGLLLAAIMLILSTQTSRARSAPEVALETPAETQPIETAAL